MGEILIAKKALTPEQLDEALKKQQKNSVDSTKKSPPPGARRLGTESTVKLGTSRLDAMLNMVGELIIAQAMVSQDLGGVVHDNRRLERNARHLTKIMRDLQELSMSMRMVPVPGVFQKMARMVRDLARKTGKQIDFVMTGADTEIDRNVVEVIADPLMHMVRNAPDHGVGLPQQRQAAGENPLARNS